MDRMESSDDEKDVFNNIIAEEKENTVDCTIVVAELFSALTEQDIYCVKGFYLDGKSEREIEREGRMTRYALSNRKFYALKKMKKYADQQGISFEKIFYR